MKIQLKRSNVLDGGEAKKPTANQMEYGELAVNYNNSDPAVFIKDSNDNIVRIAGAGANGNIEIPDSGGGSHQPDTLDDRYVEVTGDTMNGQLTLPGGGGATDALQKQEVEALIDASDTGDGKYLKLAADAGDQTVASTGKTTFDGVVEAGSGVKVTGGTDDDIDYGIRKDTNNDSIHINTNGLASVSVSKTGALGFPGINQRFRMNIGGEIPAANNDTVSISGIQISPTFSVGDYSGVSVFQKSTGGYKGVRIYNTAIDAGAAAYGIYSDLASQTNADKFNFYAANNAPSFLKGNTYIGGDVSRNTFELWKSTLTEEQLEQITDGTLAIPANVSTPGDGSFVRQWWYDQQDAETQAELDAGTLDYPTHLAAATFTDTFALGDNTSINLLSSGVVQNAGIQFINNNTNNRIQSRGIVYSTAYRALLSINRPNSAGEDVEVFLARSDNSEFDANGNRIPVNISRATSFKAENPFGSSNGTYGTYDSYVGFNATDLGIFEQDAVWTGDDDSYGFLSSLSTATGTGGGQTYNFYAENNAPNYFRGSITGGGVDGANAVWSIEANGTATGITVTRAAVVTDEQAGTVETLLDIITDLRTRLAALEAAS